MYAIIMAGGAGTRFWPLSRRQHPKQLLRFFGERSMIAEAVDRLTPLFPPERIIIVTGATLVSAVQEAVPEVPAHNIIAEPVGRNTAPCIGLATHLIQTRAEIDEDPLIGVFAADHYVANPSVFRDDIKQAFDAAKPGTIATLGIVPTRPETGYGYLKVAGDAKDTVASVERFVEKPDAETARSYLAEGGYLWNAGLFFFRASTMLAEIKRQLPELATQLHTIRPSLGTDTAEQTIASIFPTIASVSIDYGVMEGALDVKVVPTQAGWSDVGHWDALHDILPTDTHNNIINGDVIAIDTQNTVVLNHNSEHVVALAGIDNLVVVSTPDATLVLPRSRAQDVRKIVDALKKAKRDDAL